MKTLQHFNEFVKEISSDNSRKFKQGVLEKYKDDPVIHRYLKIAFDPYAVYGISDKKLAKEVRVGETLCPPDVFGRPYPSERDESVDLDPHERCALL